MSRPPPQHPPPRARAATAVPGWAEAQALPGQGLSPHRHGSTLNSLGISCPLLQAPCPSHHRSSPARPRCSSKGCPSPGEAPGSIPLDWHRCPRGTGSPQTRGYSCVLPARPSGRCRDLASLWQQMLNRELLQYFRSKSTILSKHIDRDLGRTKCNCCF